MALGLSTACGPAPSEVVDVYDGKGTSSSSGPAGSGPGVDHGSTGPVADGSGSATAAEGSTSMGSTTEPVDPGTSTGDTASASTGAASTSGPPDPSTTTGASPSCDEIFGTASGYLLCVENEGECQFGVNTGGTSCNTVCASFGQTCLGALDNPGGGLDPCFVEGTDDCTTVHNTEICICSK